MTHDEIIEMAREIAKQFGTRLTDEDGDTYGGELYCMGIDDIVEAIKLVAAHVSRELAKECAGSGEWTAVHIIERVEW